MGYGEPWWTLEQRPRLVRVRCSTVEPFPKRSGAVADLGLRPVPFRSGNFRSEIIYGICAAFPSARAACLLGRSTPGAVLKIFHGPGLSMAVLSGLLYLNIPT